MSTVPGLDVRAAFGLDHASPEGVIKNVTLAGREAALRVIAAGMAACANLMLHHSILV